MSEYISTITDNNGISRPLKDKEARELIESLKKTVEGLSGGSVDFATTEEVNALRGQVSALNEALQNLDTTYASDLITF